MHTERDRLADGLRRAGAAIGVLSSGGDVCYATGFEVPVPIDAGAEFAGGPPLAFVSAEGRTLLLAPNVYAATAKKLSRADETILFPTFDHFEPIAAQEEYEQAVRSTLRELGVATSGTIAVDRQTLPASVAEQLDRARVVDVRAVAREARLVKTPRELELLRAAVAAADAGQEALLDLARAGANELDVFGNLLTCAERTAGQPLPWAGELVTGPRTAVVRYPGGPIDRDMEAGDTVLLDLSVRLRGYWADCCNTLVVEREPSDEQLRYFRAARSAFEAAFAELRPGRRACDVHAAAVSALASHGFEPAHYTGHQLGTSVNEDPRLVPYDDTPIEAGMVFAVEPGVYAGVEGSTGARTEKIVLVTEGDPELLSTFRWGMDS